MANVPAKNAPAKSAPGKSAPGKPAPVKRDGKEKAPRRHLTVTPKDVYDYAVATAKQGALTRKMLADQFNVAESASLMALFDYCASKGVAPPKFTSLRSSSASGTVLVRKAGGKDSTMSALNIGNAYLVQMGITEYDSENPVKFAIELDKDKGVITLTRVEDEE